MGDNAKRVRWHSSKPHVSRNIDRFASLRNLLAFQTRPTYTIPYLPCMVSSMKRRGAEQRRLITQHEPKSWHKVGGELDDLKANAG